MTLTEESQRFEKLLNNNGYSFQYAVIRKAQELSTNRTSAWQFVGSEIPVMIGEKVIHIDFVFKHKCLNIFLIGECKRADPALANWVFVKSPYTFRNSKKETTLFDLIRNDGQTFRVEYGCKICATTRDICHLGFEVKTGQIGDGIGGKNQSINSAVSQVLRSSSGFINMLFAPHHLREIRPNDDYYFVPVVFTTANIFTSEVDLSSANLSDGNLPSGTVALSKKGWIWFNHSRSDELKHNLEHSAIGDIYQKLEHEFERSIAIVGSDSISDFLETDFENWMM